MNISNILEGQNIEKELLSILNDIHNNGPINPAHFETLALIKKYHPSIFSLYEKKIRYLLGLFYQILIVFYNLLFKINYIKLIVNKV